VVNVGGSVGTYNLSDTPAPDTNVTVNGASVTGQATNTFVGVGPYALASGASIAVGATHTYTLTVDLTLESQVLAGAAFVTACGDGNGTPTAGEGLFNAATVTYGTNSTTITTNDCGDIPPFILIDKTCGNIPPIPRYTVTKQRISPIGHPAVLGEPIVFTLTVANTGDVGLGIVPLVDTYNTSLLSFSNATPAPDTALPGILTWTNVGPLDVGQSVVVTARFTAVSFGIGTNRVVVSPVTTNGIPLIPQTSSAPHEANAGSISGSVFNDVNGNGAFDPADNVGIPNAVVTLLDSNSVVVGVVTTGVSGAYSFTNLPPGNYTVVETDAAGYYSTGDIDGGNPNQISVPLAVGQNSTGNDFLDALYAFVGDRVWLDEPLFTTGVQDPLEAGLGGFRMTLYTTNDVVVGVVTSRPSGPAGFYGFSNLVAGSYYIRISLPLGNALVPQFRGGNPALDSDFSPTNARSPVFTLVPGQVNTNIDAGIYEVPVFAQILDVFGRTENGQAVLVWETESEYGTAGWYVERETSGGDWTRVSGYLPAIGSVLSGGVYRWVDESAVPGDAYRYRVVEVETSGNERFSDSHAVVFPATSSKRLLASTGSFDAEVKSSRAIAARSTTSATVTPSTQSGGVVEAVKVGVREDGLYVVTAANIASVLGMSEEAVLASPIRVEHLGVTMPSLRESGDVLFYGAAYETMYTDLNVYRIVVGAGLDIADVAVSPASGAAASSFTAQVDVERQLVVRPDLFASAESDIWLWQHLITGVRTQFNATMDVPGLASSATASLTVKLKGSSPHAHRARIALNGVELGLVDFQGTELVERTLSVPAGLLQAAANQIHVSPVATAAGVFDSFYVDGFQASYQKQYQAIADRLVFDAAAGSVAVGGFSSDLIEVWDVSDAANPVRLTGFGVSGGAQGYAVNFEAEAAGTYVATAVPAAPAFVSAWYANDLKSGAHRVDYLVVYGNGLQDGAVALAADRAAKGLATKLVSVESIFDAFNHGIRDGRAIKAFLGYAYRQWMTGPRYVVLAGDGSLDYRNYLGMGASLVPTPPADHPNGVFASDHGLGDIDGDGHLDVAVGRVPVANAAQMAQYVAKVKAFEQGGAWRENITVSTDNQDAGGYFRGDGDRLADLVAGKTVQRADMDDLGATGTAQAFVEAVNAGSEFTAFIGHGNMQRLAMEGILTDADLGSLVNSEKPGVMAAIGCLMGTFGLPGHAGIGEKLVTGPAGAAALVGSSAMINNRGGVALGESLVDRLYRQNVARLGDAWVDAKNGLDSESNRRVAATYQLLGDPSLALGDVAAPRGGPEVAPARPSYDEWISWAFPAAWLEKGLSTDPNADPDGDGYSNYDEYLAGTDPLNVESELVVVTVRPLSGGGTELSWPSVAGRRYVIERASTLHGTYSAIADAVEATPDRNVWTDGSAPAQAFYRVRVK
jgi:hypothetical protein